MEHYKKKYINKTAAYPELTAQQLLSLIRANQILITDLEARVIFLEKKLLGGKIK